MQAAITVLMCCAYLMQPTTLCVFHTPCGFLVFQVLCCETGNNQGSFGLRVAGVQQTTAVSVDPSTNPNLYPQAAASINLQLAAGQVVDVINFMSTVIDGTHGQDMRSWFTGYLIAKVQ